MEILMEKESEVYLKLSCEPGIRMELNQYYMNAGTLPEGCTWENCSDC